MIRLASLAGWTSLLALSATPLVLTTHIAKPGARQVAPDSLGLTVGNSREDGRPVVTSLMSGGAAERAGIHVGDEIETIDGRTPRDAKGFRQSLHLDHACHMIVDLRRGHAMIVATLQRCTA